MNGNDHSCSEEEFNERSATVVAACVEMFLSGLHNCDCLYGSFRLCTKRFEGMRMRAACGETTVYHVPIYGRQPCQLASISLCSLIWHAFFVGNDDTVSLALALFRQALPLLSVRTVNADKRYPLPWPPPHARGTRKPELIFCLMPQI